MKKYLLAALLLAAQGVQAADPVPAPMLPMPKAPANPPTLPAPMAPPAPGVAPAPSLPPDLALDSLAAAVSRPLPSAKNARVSADFPQGTPLQEFARVILQNVLEQPFIFSSEFLANSDRIGFSTKTLNKKTALSLLRQVLAEHGYMLELRGGYYRIKPSADADVQDFVYKLKYRDIGYITEIIQPLFSGGEFSFKRAAPSTDAKNSGNSAADTSGAKNRPVDSGSSAYSATSKNDVGIFVFRGTASEVERLKTFLALLDVPIARARIESILVEVGATDSASSSIQAVASALGGRLGVSIGTAPSGNSFQFKGPDVSAVFSVLESQTGFQVLTNPSVFVDSGKSATLSVGSSVPTLGAIQTMANGTTQQSVNYLETGTIFKLAPQVLDSSIQLQVEQELSDAVNTTTGLESTPTLLKKQINTVLTLADGEWVIMGGLESSNNSDTGQGLFGFRPFKSKSHQKSRVVLLLHVSKQ